jgi:Tol biopolymer transport system component
VSVLTGSTRLLSGENASRPVPSPDGRLVIYKVSGPDHDELWVMNADGSSPRRVLALERGEKLFAVAWAPDGTKLAILRRRALGKTPETEAAIEVWDLEGQQKAVLVSNPGLVHRFINESGGLAWLPDGRLLYSLSEPPPNWDDMNIWALPVDQGTGRASGAPARITSGTATSALVNKASPGGTHLLITKVTTQMDVFVGELSENGTRLSEPRRLTFSNRNDSPCGWMRDGRLLFVSDRNGNFDIFAQALDSREPKGLVTGPGSRGGAIASPDGKAILYAEVQGSDLQSATEFRGMRLDLAEGTTRELGLFPAGAVGSMPLRGDAPGILAEPRDREIVLSLLDPMQGKGREFARLPWTKGTNFSATLSPDGSRCAVLDASGDQNLIRIVEVPGGQVRTIAVKGYPKLNSISFSADGEGLFAAAPGEGQAWLILRASLDGEATVLRRADHPGEAGWWLAFPTPSPDGRHIAFVSTSLASDHWLLENF